MRWDQNRGRVPRYQHQETHYPPDGVQRVIRCVGMPVRENGVVTRFACTLMDITEQEELTQDLRRSEAYLAEAQRLSHTGSFGWDVWFRKA